MTKHGLNLKGFIRQFQINTTLDVIFQIPGLIGLFLWGIDIKH